MTTMSASSSTTAIDGLKPLPYLGGYDALELWPTVNLCMFSWALLFLLPKWKHTPTITLIVPLILAVMYTLVLASTISNASPDDPPVDMMTFEGVLALFKDPSGVLAGWLHYCVYDPLVGRWIVLDSIKRGSYTLKFHVLVMVPLLLIAMFIPPTGWLLYMAVVRPFFLKDEGKASEEVGEGEGGKKEKGQ